MLQDAANVATLGDAPWALAPAAAIFIVVLAVNVIVQRGDAVIRAGFGRLEGSG
jgi:ABC-type dipeptide/oligopeptide/nickel transport system permease subunit